MSKQKKKIPKKDTDLIITPAGPRPREKVRSVKPDEAVHRNPDGSFSVVPRTPQTGEKEKTDG